MSAPQIKSRPPTGRVPWPLVLLEGEEKSGRSYAAALLTASERTGQAFWLDWGEGAADEYGAIPGADYQILEHDGTWPAILAQVRAVKAEARRAVDAGENPVVLIIDSLSAEWEQLKSLADQMARERLRRQKGSAPPADRDVTIGMDLWNRTGERHRSLMTQLLTFPGIVVVIARGGEVAKVGKDGKPVEGAKDYRVEGHKTLAYDATAWVRMFRTAPPRLIGARSVHAGVRPGSDEPHVLDDFTLESLIFDRLRCDPRQAHTRDLAPEADLDRDTEVVALEFRDRALEPDVTRQVLLDLYREVETAGLLAEQVTHDGQLVSLEALVKARAEQIKKLQAVPADGAA